MLRRIGIWGWLTLGVSLLGLALRVEHALTFDHVKRASDYSVHLEGVRWMQQYWRPFYHFADLNDQVRSDPPLWYFLSAIILKVQSSERWLAALSVLPWMLRHFVLWKILQQALPHRKLSQLAALSMHAVLPLSVLIDGKVNPEGLYAGMFTLALYCLWSIERQCHRPGGVSLVTGAAFGAFAGLALLAKLTGAVLLVLGPLVLLWLAVSRAKLVGQRAAFRTLVRPALAAAVMWCVVAGWWSGSNLARFHHPFPHVWNLADSSGDADLAKPAPYRRPMGWALPFEWREYWRFPILRTTTEPRPNFWATEIAGTWSDIYNRGFCRLSGGPTIDRVWGARHGTMGSSSDVWAVSQRCVDWLAAMLHVGVWLTVAAVASVLWCLWRALRSWGTRGSLTLAMAPLLCTAAGFWLALAFPRDHMAALNPRYLLAQVTPMCACLGLGLAELEALASRRGRRAALAQALLWAVLALTAVIAFMLLYERFGR